MRITAACFVSVSLGCASADPPAVTLASPLFADAALPPPTSWPAARAIPPFPAPDAAPFAVGGGAERAKPGDIVTLDFAAWTADGTLWDSTFLRARAQRFVLGDGRLPRGVDEALVGAVEGARGVLRLTPEQVYGPGGVPGRIPPQGGAVIEVWVRAIDPAPPYVPAPTREVRSLGGFEVADLRVGDGPALQPGDEALLDVTTFRGGTLEATTTTRPEPVAVRWIEPPPPFGAALEGMRAGGVRQIHLADGAILEISVAQGTRQASGS
jgi:FKBP-type peptidyl-prolyl cis-trans isomerase